VAQVLRTVTCKRFAEKLIADLANFDGHVLRFVNASPRFAGWKIEKIAVAPVLGAGARRAAVERGSLPEDLKDLTAGLVKGT
jgi:hypothetical protein